jgi:hypothetical protein
MVRVLRWTSNKVEAMLEIDGSADCPASHTAQDLVRAVVTERSEPNALDRLGIKVVQPLLEPHIVARQQVSIESSIARAPSTSSPLDDLVFEVDRRMMACEAKLKDVKPMISPREEGKPVTRPVKVDLRRHEVVPRPASSAAVANSAAAKRPPARPPATASKAEALAAKSPTAASRARPVLSTKRPAHLLAPTATEVELPRSAVASVHLPKQAHTAPAVEHGRARLQAKAHDGLHRLHRLLNEQAYWMSERGQDWAKLFRQLDRNHDGHISHAEFHWALRAQLDIPESSVSTESVDHFLALYDSDRNAHIELAELIRFINTPFEKMFGGAHMHAAAPTEANAKLQTQQRAQPQSQLPDPIDDIVVINDDGTWHVLSSDVPRQRPVPVLQSQPPILTQPPTQSQPHRGPPTTGRDPSSKHPMQEVVFDEFTLPASASAKIELQTPQALPAGVTLVEPKGGHADRSPAYADSHASQHSTPYMHIASTAPTPTVFERAVMPSLTSTLDSDGGDTLRTRFSARLEQSEADRSWTDDGLQRFVTDYLEDHLLMASIVEYERRSAHPLAARDAWSEGHMGVESALGALVGSDGLQLFIECGVAVEPSMVLSIAAELLRQESLKCLSDVPASTSSKHAASPPVALTGNVDRVHVESLVSNELCNEMVLQLLLKDYSFPIGTEKNDGSEQQHQIQEGDRPVGGSAQHIGALLSEPHAASYSKPTFLEAGPSLVDGCFDVHVSMAHDPGTKAASCSPSALDIAEPTRIHLDRILADTYRALASNEAPLPISLPPHPYAMHTLQQQGEPVVPPLSSGRLHPDSTQPAAIAATPPASTASAASRTCSTTATSPIKEAASVGIQTVQTVLATFLASLCLYSRVPRAAAARALYRLGSVCGRRGHSLARLAVQADTSCQTKGKYTGATCAELPPASQPQPQPQRYSGSPFSAQTAEPHSARDHSMPPLPLWLPATPKPPQHERANQDVHSECSTDRTSWSDGRLLAEMSLGEVYSSVSPSSDDSTHKSVETRRSPPITARGSALLSCDAASGVPCQRMQVRRRAAAVGMLRVVHDHAQRDARS